MAAALGVRQRQGATVEESVVDYLRMRRLLVVLDNCEHVLDATARLVDALVASCPGVVVLATSREALDVPGEQVWPVPPLSAADAAELFVARARATRPDFDAGRGPSRRSAGASTGCRWASSWPPPGCGR